ncbi:MAG: hypothetical protein ACRDVZ_14295, partial [Jiangellaceae bacterium]
MPGENTVRPTEVGTDHRQLLDAEAGVVAIPVWPGGDSAVPWIGSQGAELAEAFDLDLFGALERDHVTGKAGEVVTVPVGAAGRGAASPDGNVDLTRVLLVGLGDG